MCSAVLLSYVTAAAQARPPDNKEIHVKEPDTNAKAGVQELPPTVQKKEDSPVRDNKSEHHDSTVQEAVKDRLNDPKHAARVGSESQNAAHGNLKSETKDAAHGNLKSETKDAARDHDASESQMDLKSAAHGPLNSETKNAARDHASEPQSVASGNDAHKTQKA